MNERSTRVGWQIVELARASATSLEERATRVVPAVTAGLIGLWTQLHSFDNAAASALAWTAWLVLLVAVGWLARLLTLRRLTRFWQNLLREARSFSGDEEAEAALVNRLAVAIEEQIDTLRLGLQVTIWLAAVALGLAGLAYVVERATT